MASTPGRRSGALAASTPASRSQYGTPAATPFTPLDAGTTPYYTPRTVAREDTDALIRIQQTVDNLDDSIAATLAEVAEKREARKARIQTLRDSRALGAYDSPGAYGSPRTPGNVTLRDPPGTGEDPVLAYRNARKPPAPTDDHVAFLAAAQAEHAYLEEQVGEIERRREVAIASRSSRGKTEEALRHAEEAMRTMQEAAEREQRDKEEGQRAIAELSAKVAAAERATAEQAALLQAEAEAAANAKLAKETQMKLAESEAAAAKEREENAKRVAQLEAKLAAAEVSRAAHEEARRHEEAARLAHEKTEEALRLMRAKQAVAEEEKAETQRQVAALQAKLAAAKALEHEQEMMLRKGVAATEAERTADEKFRELESKKEASKREREAAALRVAQLQAELQAAEESTKRQSVGGNMSAQVAAERRRTRDAEEKLRAHEDAERRLKAEHERQIGDLEERLNAIQDRSTRQAEQEKASIADQQRQVAEAKQRADDATRLLREKQETALARREAAVAHLAALHAQVEDRMAKANAVAGSKDAESTRLLEEARRSEEEVAAAQRKLEMMEAEEIELQRQTKLAIRDRQIKAEEAEKRAEEAAARLRERHEEVRARREVSEAALAEAHTKMLEHAAAAEIAAGRHDEEAEALLLAARDSERAVGEAASKLAELDAEAAENDRRYQEALQNKQKEAATRVLLANRQLEDRKRAAEARRAAAAAELAAVNAKVEARAAADAQAQSRSREQDPAIARLIAETQKSEAAIADANAKLAELDREEAALQQNTAAANRDREEAEALSAKRAAEAQQALHERRLAALAEQEKAAAKGAMLSPIEKRILPTTGEDDAETRRLLVELPLVKQEVERLNRRIADLDEEAEVINAAGPSVAPIVATRTVSAPAPRDLEESKTNLQALQSQDSPRSQHADLVFPPLPEVKMELTENMGTRYINADHLLSVIDDHLEAQKHQSEELASVGEKLRKLREAGMAKEKHTVSLQCAVMDHLMAHRKHDRQMIEVMTRLMDPTSTGVVDSGVTPVDNARATLLTAIDFMILDEETRNRLESLLEDDDLEQAQFEIEAHQRVDIQRADEDVEERMAYEQLALRQIARENPSAVLASFLDRHCPDQGGIRHAPPTSPLKTVNDLAATGWDDDIALDQSNSAISRASSSVPQALQKSKVRLSTLLQCAVCQHFTPVIPDEYRNLEFPELPKILDRLTDAMVKRATNVGTLLASIEAHIKADKAENTELTRMGNELKELEATGQANATHATALERALAKHLTSHRRHDRQLLEVMSRLLESTAPVVDVAISPVDTARAAQLTTIDFFILDNAKRAELTGLVESRNPSASAEIAKFQRIDAQRAENNPDERVVYEQLAFMQISEENLSTALIRLLEMVGVGGTPRATPALRESRPPLIDDLDEDSEQEWTLDQADQTYSLEDPEVGNQRREAESKRWEKSKNDLDALQTVRERISGGVDTEFNGLVFPSLPSVDLSQIPANIQYTNGFSLEEVALAHRTEHETDADAIAEVQDELMDQLEDGDVDEEQVTDMLGQISMLLFNHRQHDHEIVQVLARISQPGGTGIVDCTVTDVDEATANLLTQLDFMILDDADRQRLEDIVYDDNAGDAAVAAVKAAAEEDTVRYKAHPRERSAYEQKALEQIAQENPTLDILEFMNTHLPVGSTGEPQLPETTGAR